MQEKTRQEQYTDYIDTNILSHINYKRLQTSYDGDKRYAKEVLSALHDAVEKCYGTSVFNPGDCQDSGGLVTLPGIAYDKNTEKIAVILVDIALSASGEHWETNFLLDVGVVEQIPEDKALADRIKRDFTSYDYWYTPFVADDHHVNFDTLPKVVQDILNTFQDSGEKETGQKNSRWPRFEKAKRKAAEMKDTSPPKTPKRSNQKEK